MSEIDTESKKYTAAEMCGVSVAAEIFSGYPLSLVQLAAGTVSYELTRNLPPADVVITAIAVLGVATLVGGVYEAMTVKDYNCGYNAKSNAAFQLLKKVPVIKRSEAVCSGLAVAAGTAWGYGQSLTNVVDMGSASTLLWANDGGQWMAGYMIGKSVVGLAYSLEANKLIRERKVEWAARMGEKAKDKIKDSLTWAREKIYQVRNL